MKKGLITIILTLILIFNTYSPTFATTPYPAAAIPVTAYEVYTYITLVLTYMGVEYKNAQERKQWLEDEYGPNTPTYQSVEDILRQAKINFSNEPPNYNPKPEPRQIAIPVPDSIIDSLYNKLKDLVNNASDDVTITMVDFLDGIKEYIIFSVNQPDFSYVAITNQYYNIGYRLQSKNNSYFISIPGVSNSYYTLTSYCFKSDGTFYKQGYSTNLPFNYFKYYKVNKVIIDKTNTAFSLIKINLPTGDFIRNWTSPYTGMQTVTMPLTTTGIESPVEVPVIPSEYVEPAPDEVTNPIQNPENDPLINPETGLPFIDPETGLPIFPSTPIVPVTPITPIPQPEELTQPKDYTPNLTEISNGIKQLPERIINPIKKLFIPDKVSKIDFSPLNVPITKKFPFSIPFDLSNMFKNFSAGGEPPKWDINLVFMDYSETVTIDLAMFEKWAEIIRFFVFIGFNIGLILVTRNLIRG